MPKQCFDHDQNARHFDMQKECHICGDFLYEKDTYCSNSGSEFVNNNAEETTKD